MKPYPDKYHRFTVAYRFTDGREHETYLSFKYFYEAKEYAEKTINMDEDIETITVEEVDYFGDPLGVIAYKRRGESWVNVWLERVYPKRA